MSATTGKLAAAVVAGVCLVGSVTAAPANPTVTRNRRSLITERALRQIFGPLISEDGRVVMTSSRVRLAQ